MHKRLASILIIFTAVAFAADSNPARDWQSDLLAWREKRAAGLQAPEGWLSLIGLEWLKEGDNSVGSGTGNKIQIAKAPAQLAVVRLEKGGALRLMPPAAGFPSDLMVDGHPAHEQPLLADDSPNPSKLSFGSITIIVIHRD